MFARLGPNTMAEMQPIDGSASSGAGPVQGILDWELGVISEQTRWMPPLVKRATATPDSLNSEMDAEGEELEEESSEDGSRDDEVDTEPQLAQPSAHSEVTQASTSSVPASGPPPVPVSSEPPQMATGSTTVEASPDLSAFGRFRIHPPTSLPDPLSYPTMPYYSLMPPRYMPHIPNPPLNPVHIPFLPNPVGNTTRNGANNGLRTKDGSSAHGSTRVANETDKPTTSTENPSESSSSIAAGDSVAPPKTTTPASSSAYNSSTMPNLDLSAFPPNSAAATIGRILAMNPGMPIDAFKEVIAVEAGKSSTTGKGEVVGQLGGEKGATLLWKDAILGQKGKGKEKEGTVSHSEVQVQPSGPDLSEVSASAQNRPSHWRGEIVFQVKPGEVPVEKQAQTAKGKTKNPPPKQVAQKTLQNTWRVDPTTLAGPTTSSVSVLPRVRASPQEAPLAQESSHSHLPAHGTVDSSRQTKAGSSKLGTSGDSKASQSNASKQQSSSNPSKKAALSSVDQATGPGDTPTMHVPSTGISPYMVPYGSYTYPPMTSQSPYQYPNPYYPYYYPSYSPYGYGPPFSGNVPPSTSSPPPSASSPPASSQAKATQLDPKPSRKRKTRKGEAAAPTPPPPPPLEPCCVAAGVDSSHLTHTYPSYSYPTTSYPPSYGYTSSSYTSAYMQSRLVIRLL
ncbi:hypothetical protein BJ165DRAFT_297383 [Panaeolus papilionaceus]|nr:hypothetical protein BJ165DRAFT_297383 [Panaeolus papilionaceus]